MFKKIKYILFFVWCATIFVSCTNTSYDNSIDGFCKLESDLIQRFGQDSYFTDVTILQNKKNELEIQLLVTENPYSYQMEGWSYKNGDWQKITEVDLELAKGDIVNYLYTINHEVNLIKMGYLIESCIERTKAKGYNNIAFNKINIVSPDSGDKSKMGYDIQVMADNTKINYSYTLEGNLIEDTL